MSVTIKSTNNIPRLTEALKQLGKKEIKVGIFGKDSNVDNENINLVTLARVHEFGMNIKPKNAQWLTIPIIPEAHGKKASDFSGLVFRKGADSNVAFLDRVTSKGRGKNQKSQMQSVFLLVKSVNIPERSFLRAGFDSNINAITNKIKKHLNDVLNFGINPAMFADAVGREFAGMIQKYARDLKSPPKSPITLSSAPNKTNPLIQTGHMIRSIRHEVK